jgi:DNA polymerase-3 subunit gamma/tau
MSYHALARKYRPSTFGEMVGQEHVSRTLRAALRNDKLAHAYLFSGPRGCGKTTIARLLAKALNCTEGPADEPCGACDRCVGIAAGTWLDVLEIDAASHTGVDNIRELRDMAQYTPSQGSSRVFIIDEVHMLSKGAFNALLKILEEPPPRVFFFFATTEPNKIPRTILSRCQRFDFRLLTRDELAARVEEIVALEKMTIDPGALRLVVAQAEGSMRDGLSILDQVLAACEGHVTEKAVVEQFGLIQSELFTELNDAVLAHDAAATLRLADRIVAGGQSLEDFSQQLVSNMRNLLLLKIDPALAAGISLPEEQIAILKNQADQFSEQDLLALLDRASRGYERIRRSTQPRIQLEGLLVELALMESRVMLSDLVRRLDALASGAPSGGGLTGGAAASSGNRGSAPGAPTRGHQASATTAPAEPSAGIAFKAAAATTVPGWTEFISATMAEIPGVGACLMEGVPCHEGEDTVVLSYPAGKEFHLKQVEQGLAVVVDMAQRYLGRKLVLQLINGDHEARTVHMEKVRREVTPTENEALNKACQADSTLDKLVEMIDGEIVPSAEKEDWLRVDRKKKPATEDNSS